MAQAMAESGGKVPMSPGLQATLLRAREYAASQSQAQVLLEHLLLALTEDADAAHVLEACQVDLVRLRHDVAGFIGSETHRVPPGTPGAPAISPALTQVLKYATLAAQQGRRASIDGAIVLAALVGDGRSMAANFLKAQGLTFEAAIRALKEAAARPAPRPPIREALVSPPHAPSSAEDASRLQPDASHRQRSSEAGSPEPPVQRERSPDTGPPSRTDDILARARERVESRTGRTEPHRIDTGRVAPQPQLPAATSEPLQLPPQPPDRHPFETAQAGRGQAATISDADGFVPSEATPNPHGVAQPPAVRDVPALGAPAYEPPALQPPPSVPAPFEPPQFGSGADATRGFEPAPPGQGMLFPHASPAGPGAPMASSPQRQPDAVQSAVPANHRLSSLNDRGPSERPAPDRSGQARPPLPLPQTRPLPLPPPQQAQAETARQPASGPPATPPPGWAPPPRQSAPHPGSAPPPRGYPASPPPPSPQALAPNHPGQGPADWGPADRGPADWGSRPHDPSAPLTAPPLRQAWTDAGPNPPPAPPGGYRQAPPGTNLPAVAPSRRPAVDAAQISHTLPRRLQEGRAQVIEIRIERPPLAGPASGGARPDALRAESVVARAIAVRLRPLSGRFIVDALSPETQWDQSANQGAGRLVAEGAVWRFTVTPLASGRSALQLAVSARTLGADGVLCETQLPDQSYDVRVAPAFGTRLARIGVFLLVALGSMLAIKLFEGMMGMDFFYLGRQLLR